MLIIFQDMDKNLIEVSISSKDKFIIEQLDNYEYNIYNEIIPSKMEYLIQIISNNININKFFSYKKDSIFHMYIYNYHLLPLPLPELSLDTEEFENILLKINNDYIKSNNLMKIFQIFFQNVSLEIINNINIFHVSLKLINNQ